MGILDDDHSAEREQVVEMLKKAYWMEIETVMSYIANSINPDGVRAREVIDSLEQDIQEELGHAQLFGKRIKELYGVVPGSSDFSAEQTYLQPPDDQMDIVHVIKGVIEAEKGAIDLLQRGHRVHRLARRPGDGRHGHDDPRRRGGAPPALRGLPEGVRGLGGQPAEQDAVADLLGVAVGGADPRHGGGLRGGLACPA